MKKNETKTTCKFYTWGNVVPRAYGAYCKYFKTFFSITSRFTNDLDPQCWGCKAYKRRRNNV